MSNLLLVEGATEKRLIPELVEQRGVAWNLGVRKYAVEIQNCGGFDALVALGEIETALKSSGLKALGVIFDADGLHGGEGTRWLSIWNRCKEIGIVLPNEPEPNGFITTLPSGVRFGLWMMPDNIRRGMLETFLFDLLPPDFESVPYYAYAREAVERAKELGAPYKLVHKDKALIHNWLAWQDAPGAQLHEAVKFRILKSESPKADAFVGWFRSLYAL